jgi:hypothetical protein
VVLKVHKVFRAELVLKVHKVFKVELVLRGLQDQMVMSAMQDLRAVKEQLE